MNCSIMCGTVCFSKCGACAMGISLWGWAVLVALGAFLCTLAVLVARHGSLGTVLSPAALFGKDRAEVATPAPGARSPQIQVLLLCGDADADAARDAVRAAADSASRIQVRLVPCDAGEQAALAALFAQDASTRGSAVPEFTLVTRQFVQWKKGWDTALLAALGAAVAAEPGVPTLLTGLAPGTCAVAPPPPMFAAPMFTCRAPPQSQPANAPFYELAPALSLSCLFGATASLQAVPFISSIEAAEEQLLAYVLHARLFATGVRVVGCPTPPFVARELGRSPSTPRSRAGNAALLEVLARFQESGSEPAMALAEFQRFAGVPRAELLNVQAPPPW